jgi:acetyl esterase
MGGTVPLDPEAKTLLETLSGGEEVDPLRDEGSAYAGRLDTDGTATTHTNYPGVFHGFFGMPEQLPRARQAVDEACAALRKAFRV